MMQQIIKLELTRIAIFIAYPCNVTYVFTFFLPKVNFSVSFNSTEQRSTVIIFTLID